MLLWSLSMHLWSLSKSGSADKVLKVQAVQKQLLCRWAVGVLMYEMVAGYPPFYDEDRVAMFRNICQVKYTVPSHFSKVRHHSSSYIAHCSLAPNESNQCCG